MKSSNINLRDLDLPLKQLPVVSDVFSTMITATKDNLPGYFASDQLESTVIPQGWDIHFDVITQIREEGYWEDFSALIADAVSLSASGAKFAVGWNKMVEECVEEYESNGKVLELKLKEDAVVSWNENVAKLRREVERKFRLFERRARDVDLEHQIKRCFGAHRNLGADGDGREWWKTTVGLLLMYAEEWTEVAFTLEMWLDDFGVLVKEKSEIEEVRVYADTLCASYEQAKGMSSRRELVFLIRDGKVSKRGRMAWVSTELGHVTED